MIFPVAGPHSIGQGFGAGRSGGHRHEGQDIMAACGTPLVAVSRAKVKFVSTQKLAGNYVVIRNKKLHQDYMYAHLATRASVTKGQVVQPGQQIGIVGHTGDATACHLHFELWLGKWYRGGHPINPMPYLQTYARLLGARRRRRSRGARKCSDRALRAVPADDMRAPLPVAASPVAALAVLASASSATQRYARRSRARTTTATSTSPASG